MNKSIALIFTLLILIISGCKTQNESLSEGVTPIPLSSPAQTWKPGDYLTNVQKMILQAAPRKNPEQPFSFKNPAGPAFSEEQ